MAASRAVSTTLLLSLAAVYRGLTFVEKHGLLDLNTHQESEFLGSECLVWPSLGLITSLLHFGHFCPNEYDSKSVW